MRVSIYKANTLVVLWWRCFISLLFGNHDKLWMYVEYLGVTSFVLTATLQTDSHVDSTNHDYVKLLTMYVIVVGLQEMQSSSHGRKVLSMGTRRPGWRSMCRRPVVDGVRCRKSHCSSH
jgi:hypothetical protein